MSHEICLPLGWVGKHNIRSFDSIPENPVLTYWEINLTIHAILLKKSIWSNAKIFTETVYEIANLRSEKSKNIVLQN